MPKLAACALALVAACVSPSENADISVEPARPALTGVTSFALGQFHACARLVDGTLRCWGQQVADHEHVDESGHSTVYLNAAPREPTLGLAGIRRVVSAGAGVCAMLDDGGVSCWGGDASGVVFGGRTPTPGADPTDVPAFRGAVDVALGFTHTCAVLANGTVSCFGVNRSGQLGDGSRVSRTQPQLVMGITTAIRVAVGTAYLGDGHSCALLRAGTVVCWGSNVNGALGVEGTLSAARPGAVPGLVDIAEIVSTVGRTCARRNDGTVWCWGPNSNGELGDGTFLDRYMPVQVLGIQSAVRLALADEHACALSSDGTVRCWGHNVHGELGDRTLISSSRPVEVRALGGVLDIAAGGGATCAALPDMTARCWGDNTRGQTGTGVAGAVPVFLALTVRTL